MQKYLSDDNAKKVFRAFRAELSEADFAKFVGLVHEAYLEKQLSENDKLQTYKITASELESLYKKFKSSK